MDGDEGRRRPCSPKAGKSVTRVIVIWKSEPRQEHRGEGTSRVPSSYSTMEEQAANFVTLASTKLRHGICAFKVAHVNVQILHNSTSLKQQSSTRILINPFALASATRHVHLPYNENDHSSTYFVSNHAILHLGRPELRLCLAVSNGSPLTTFVLPMGL